MSPPSLAQAGPPDTRIDPTSFDRLARIIRDESGIVLNDSKRNLVVSRLSKRLRDLGIRDFGGYCRLLDGDQGSSEKRHLVSLLTTNVTRFFREGHHFEALRSTVFPPLVTAARDGRRIRIWSAGCSSGQEPVSIAITLLEGMPDAGRHDIRILATDIDPRMIEAGRTGIYARLEDSDVPAEIRRKYFSAVSREPDTWRTVPEVHGLITFAELNLMKEWPMRGKFDIIFCRNTVIYFDGDTQADLWKRFAEKMEPGSHLFVGHSERVSGPAEEMFTACGVTQYRRR